MVCKKPGTCVTALVSRLKSMQHLGGMEIMKMRPPASATTNTNTLSSSFPSHIHTYQHTHVHPYIRTETGIHCTNQQKNSPTPVPPSQAMLALALFAYVKIDFIFILSLFVFLNSLLSFRMTNPAARICSHGVSLMVCRSLWPLTLCLCTPCTCPHLTNNSTTRIQFSRSHTETLTRVVVIHTLMHCTRLPNEIP